MERTTFCLLFYIRRTKLNRTDDDVRYIVDCIKEAIEL